MPTVPYWHVDAFANRAFAGNQAAVMLFAGGFPDDATMARIAAENMFAETAFVVPHPGPEADWGLRWFAPGAEVRLCGHATLAAGHVLLGRDGGSSVRFATRQAGVLTVKRTGEGYELALPAIATAPAAHPQAVAALGAEPVATHRSPGGYNLFVYADAAEVRALAPDMAALAALGDDQFICTAPGAVGQADEAEVVSRVFVPGAGIAEDQATGSAHAVLAPIWAERLGRAAFLAEQASPRGARIACRVEGDLVWLGGGCVTVVEGRFTY